VVTDETGAEAKHAARALPEPAFYESIFETMAEGVVCQSASGEILAVNPAAERILGRSGHELPGPTLDAHWQAIHEDGTPFPAAVFPSTLALRTGQPTPSVIMGLLRPDNMRIWISLAAQPIFHPGAPRPYAVVCTFHDVTARVRAGQEVRRLNVTLERRVEERTRQLVAALSDLESFSYSVSHDLRAPLRAIDNFSSILQEEYATGLDAEGRRLIGIVRKNARTMGQLIDDILAFARAGHRDLVLADIDIGDIARDVLQDLASSYAGRRVEVDIETATRVRADAAAMRQVMTNLLANAIKFTRPKAVAHVEIRSRASANEIVCSVKDDGVGFDPEYAHKLFGVFQRLHDAEEFEGTGIGLGIVKRILDKHGGRVWAEGAPGRGAAFFFALPVIRNEGGP
jgi:PAS domain S-box-containing protein